MSCNRTVTSEAGPVGADADDFGYCLYDISDLCIHFRSQREISDQITFVKPFSNAEDVGNAISSPRGGADPSQILKILPDSAAIIEKCKQITKSFSTLGFLAVTSSSLLSHSSIPENKATPAPSTPIYSDGTSVANKVYGHMREFFTSPLEVKRGAYSKSRSTRGYADNESENFATLIGDKKPNDQVEKFRVGPIQEKPLLANSAGIAASDTAKSSDYFSCKEGRVHFFPNNWPGGEALVDMEPDVSAYYALMNDLSLTILNILEVGLDLPRNFFVSQMAYHTSILGLNYYPVVSASVLSNDHHISEIASSQQSVTSQKPPDNIRVAGHTDVSLLTIVSQRTTDVSMGGLEILPRLNRRGGRNQTLCKEDGGSGNSNACSSSSSSNNNNNHNNNNSSSVIEAVNDDALQWMKIPYDDSAFVVNIGDCLQDWTKGRLSSTLHRVTISPPGLPPLNSNDSSISNSNSNSSSNSSSVNNNRSDFSSHVHERCSIAFFVSPNYDAKLRWPKEVPVPVVPVVPVPVEEGSPIRLSSNSGVAREKNPKVQLNSELDSEISYSEWRRRHIHQALVNLKQPKKV